MTVFFRRIALTTIAALLFIASALAGTMHGTVINRTTGKPASNVDLVLISLQSGMTPVASAKSDATGAFTFDNPAIGTGPMLIRATYSGVTFNTPMPPGRPTATIEVFDVTKDPKTITVDSHLVIFQPNAGKLIGAEEYLVKNESQPPHAYFRSDGSFEFAVPENAKLQQVATTSSTGMPVPQAPIEKGNGRVAIAYAFRPGETSLRLSYELPYDGSTAVKIPATYGNMRLLIVAPPGVTLAADGLQPSGEEQGMMVYQHAPLAANSALSINISGMPTQQAADAGGPQSQQAMPQAQEGNSRAQGPDIQAVPGRLDQFKWYLLGGMLALFAMSGLLLSRKQVVVLPAPQSEGAAIGSNPSALQPQTPASASVAAVEQHVSTNLESLKDSIFRLELRRQAGTISEEDYARERAQMDQLLRNLVQG